MTPDGDDHRHHPRLPVACRVELHDRFATWAGETADVGPRGCQLLTSRAPAVGALVELAIASEHAPAPLEVVGQVTWVLPGPSTRVGISFLGRIEGRRAGPVEWFFSVLRQELAGTRRGEGGSPLAHLMVYLGPPRALDVLAPEEREIVASVGAGVRLADLVAGCSSEAAVALLRRGWLTLVRGSAVAPERWGLAPPRVGGSGPCLRTGRMSGAFAKPPPTGFEGISEEPERRAQLSETARGYLGRAVDALLDRDLFFADHLVRRALAAAPGDAAMSTILHRIEAQSGRNRAPIRLADPGLHDGRANGCDRASGS